MTLQQWRNRLVEELRRQGLPSRRVERLAEELTDHALDIISEERSMDAVQNLEARMGAPEQLAAVAKNELKKTTIAGRYPLPIFVIGPIVTVVGTMITTIQLTKLVVWLLEAGTGESLSGSFKTSLIQLGSFIVRFAPFVLSTWLFVYLGRRTGHPWWSITACGIVVLSALCLTSDVIPKSDQIPGQWILNFGFSTNLSRTFNFRHIVQAVVPLALAAGMYWQSSRSRRNPISA